MRRFTALVNPVSGGGQATRRWAPLADLLRNAGATVQVEMTRSREHAVDRAATAAQDGEIVVAVGGDGLVRDIAEGVVASGGTLAIVPAGRGNDFARHLNLPTEPDTLAEVLLTGTARPIDVIEVGDSIVVGNVYAGIDSVANHTINANRWIPPLLVYRLAPLRAMLTWRAPTYTLTVDGRSTSVRAHTVVVANSGAYGHGLRIVPPAVVDDGVLQVMTVAAGPLYKIAQFMRRAKMGTHVDLPEVRIEDAREVTIAADRQVPVYGDGDYLTELPARMRIRPGALKILVP